MRKVGDVDAVVIWSNSNTSCFFLGFLFGLKLWLDILQLAFHMGVCDFHIKIKALWIRH